MKKVQPVTDKTRDGLRCHQFSVELVGEADSPEDSGQKTVPRSAGLVELTPSSICMHLKTPTTNNILPNMTKHQKKQYRRW